MMHAQKTKKIARFLALLVAVALILTSFSFVMFLPGLLGESEFAVYAADSESQSDAYLKSEFTTMETLINTIHNNYKDEITYKKLLDGAYAGIFEALNDPYSVYFANGQEGEAFVESVNGAFSGIGVAVKDVNGKCNITQTFVGSPAEKAGIKAGDVVTAVDGVRVNGKSVDEVAALMRGEKGTKVTITVDRNGKSLSFSLVRDVIGSLCMTDKMLEGNIGYIRITSFDSDCHVEFQSALKRLLDAGANSLIIDVRNNPGGLIGPTAEIADQLMEEGPILHFKQKGEVIETIEATKEAYVNLQIVLLVNKNSASASEILAGALQDSKKAVLVGTKTFGKGVAQQVGELKNGSQIKLSTFYFLTPNKNTIDHVGITPDYVVYNGGEADIDELNSKIDAFVPMVEKVKATTGQVGLNVYGAQQRLQVLRFDVPLNATMDGKTVAAIKQFQKENGLYAYGGLDYTTIDALNNAVWEYATGTASTENDDLQLKKAIEILKN
ncbi:MAG: S41 family peptidase [Anaerovorax sp.]|nr:S41 family peptidase [Anaerovorax sp.]